MGMENVEDVTLNEYQFLLGYISNLHLRFQVVQLTGINSF